MTTSNTRVTPLDPEQRAAAEAPVGPVLILGGPGAGKTHTLIARVGVLLKTGALPGDITCIAYNNWGAQDMLRRMLKTPEIAEQARKIRFRTIERCALEVLRRLGAEASPSLSVWPRQQVEHAIRDLASKLQSLSEPIFKKIGGEDDATGITMDDRLMRRGLNQARWPERAVSIPDILTQVLNAYSEEKLKKGGVDLYDLVPMAIQAMEKDPLMRAPWQANHSLHLLVDDYQDITPAKHHFLRLITGLSGSITVGADPNQSIEQKRGADPGMLHRFQEDWPQVQIYNLQFNHRQTRSLAQATNDLADHQERTGLRSNLQWLGRPEDGIRLNLVDFSERPEAAGAQALEWAKALIEQGFTWEDMAMICCDPSDIDRMRRELEHGGVPHTVLGDPGKEPDFDTQRVINLMAWALNDRDSEAFYRAAFSESDSWCRMANRKITETIFRAAQREKIQAVEVAELKAEQLPPNEIIHRDLIKLINAWRSFVRMLDVPEVSLFDLCQCAVALVQDGPGEGADIESETDISALLEVSQTAGSTGQDTPTRRLTSFLDLLNSEVVPDFRWLENRGERARPRGVTLSTVHASKGMQWKVVFLIDAHGGKPPANSGFGPQDLRDEEDRTIFVGINRASDRLFYLGLRKSGGNAETNANWIREALKAAE